MAGKKKGIPKASRPDEKVGTPSPLFRRNPHELLRRLSYSHIEQLVDLDDDLQRAFYELECVRGNWSGIEFAVRGERETASVACGAAGRVWAEDSRHAA